MCEEKILLPDAAREQKPKSGDVDDLIFRGEGWLASDR